MSRKRQLRCARVFARVFDGGQLREVWEVDVALFPLGLGIATLVLIQWIVDPLVGQQPRSLRFPFLRSKS